MSIAIKSSNGQAAITSIDLGVSTPRLGGTVDVSQFQNLTFFRCINNDVSGVSSFGDKLGYINLANNKLVNFPNINNLTLLSTFNVANNLLGDQIPNLDNNTKLQDFNCELNNLIGNIPNLGNLPDLKGFVCFSNSLSGSIPSLSGLVNLEVFQCETQNGATKLTGQIPSLGGLVKLQNFRCSENQITGSIPSLNGLSALAEFHCHTNQISGAIPSLSGLTNLFHFNCSTNQLSGNIPSLDGLIKIDVFRCSSNQLSGSIPSLSGLVALRDFRCDANLLTGVIPSLSGLISLETFRGGSNQFSGSIPSLAGLVALRDFRCENNQLSGFDGGSVPITLGTINLQNNMLSQSAVNNLITAFALAGRDSGTRSLNLSGATNSTPDFATNVVTISRASSGVTGFPAGTFSRPANSFIVTANITGHNLSQGDIITINGVTNFSYTTRVASVISPNQFTFTAPTSSSSTVNSSNSTNGRIRKSITNDSVLFRYQQLALPNSLGGLGWTVSIRFP